MAQVVEIVPHLRERSILEALTALSRMSRDLETLAANAADSAEILSHVAFFSDVRLDLLAIVQRAQPLLHNIRLMRRSLMASDPDSTKVPRAIEDFAEEIARLETEATTAMSAVSQCFGSDFLRR